MKLESVAKEIEIQEMEQQKVNEQEPNQVDLSELVETFEDDSVRYEYYLTEKELLADIDQDIIFRVDTAFQKPMTPIVTGGKWSFYVYEDNVVNLGISYFDLIAKNRKNIFPDGEQVIVDVISPDKEQVYHFEKIGNEIMQDISVQDQIAITSGEWMLQISFAYVCDKAQSHFKVCAAYKSPSEEDICWLREDRLKEHDTKSSAKSLDV